MGGTSTPLLPTLLAFAPPTLPYSSPLSFKTPPLLIINGTRYTLFPSQKALTMSFLQFPFAALFATIFIMEK
jgi:hypothetical protein